MARRFCGPVMTAIVAAGLLFAAHVAAADDRLFGAAPRYSSYAAGSGWRGEGLRSAEALSRNFGAVQNAQPFRNQNGDFSYLTLYSSYGGYAGPYLWGGYYGYGAYSPWWYGYRYGYPYRYYPYAFGYPYGYAFYGPTYYGWPYYGGWYGYGFPYGYGYGYGWPYWGYGGGFPYTAAYYGPWWGGYYGGGWRGPLPNDRYVGCYYW